MRVRRAALAAATVLATAAPAGAAVTDGSNGSVAILRQHGTDVLAAGCSYVRQPLPDSADVAYLVDGYAAVSPDPPRRAIATTIRCQLEDAATGTLFFDHTQNIEGSAGAWLPPPFELRDDTITLVRVCVAARVIWSDGQVTGDLNDRLCDPPG